MYERTTRSWLKHVDFILLDLISITVCFVLAGVIRLGSDRFFQDVAYRNILLAIYGFHVLIAFFSHNYSEIIRRGYLDEAGAVAAQNFLILICLAIYLVFTRQSETYSRLVWVYFFIGNYCLMLLLRCIRKFMVRRSMLSRENRSEMLVLTTKDRADQCIKGLLTIDYQPFHVFGIALLDVDEKGSEIQNIKVVADADSVLEYVRTQVVDEVLLDVGQQTEVINDLVSQFLNMGIVVHIGLAPFMEELPNKQIQQMGTWDVITTSIKSASVVALFFKRTLDIIGSIVGLFITGIVFIFVAPIIHFSSPGPIFFSQERVGRNGRKFKLYKFRSMYVDAEERKQNMQDQNEVSGPMFKMDDDPRIVKGIGQFIRSTSIDELPQFWNVLRGDMSLVGTRPPTVEEYEQYEQHYKVRLSFRPGITGLWQVSGRSEITDFDEVVRLDEEYILNWSLLEDIQILFRTIIVVLARKGSK